MAKRIAVPGGYQFPEEQGVFGKWTFLPITIAVEELQLTRKLYELPPLSRTELVEVFRRAHGGTAFRFMVYATQYDPPAAWAGADTKFLELHLDNTSLYVPIGFKSEAKRILVRQSCDALFVESTTVAPHPTCHGDITHRN